MAWTAGAWGDDYADGAWQQGRSSASSDQSWGEDESAWASWKPPKNCSEHMCVGDWLCPVCMNHNFAKRVECHQCGGPRPPKRLPRSNAPPVKDGDWMCDACGRHNFAKRDSCECGEFAPDLNRRIQVNQTKDFKGGDWLCPNCNNHNFARRTDCKRCAHPAPPEKERFKNIITPNISGQGIKAGDWLCACGNHNFAFRSECGRCGYQKETGSAVDLSRAAAEVGMGNMPAADQLADLQLFSQVCNPTLPANLVQPQQVDNQFPLQNGGQEVRGQLVPAGGQSAGNQSAETWICPNPKCCRENHGFTHCRGCHLMYQKPEDIARYKTRLCKNFKATGECKRGERCLFAHGQEELNILRTQPSAQQQEEVLALTSPEELGKCWVTPPAAKRPKLA
eukprot:TRINITY_DN75918_c0_g1_i1.p1 TRINITY_DN75918_c0_g1~~TRINITY_DN75918_c0_g1_i1.p1  ORF type:complete len:394 (+),score=38.31 TRINITY_DN75918_c0_g1_i1:19-1200(+)